MLFVPQKLIIILLSIIVLLCILFVFSIIIEPRGTTEVSR